MDQLKNIKATFTPKIERPSVIPFNTINVKRYFNLFLDQTVSKLSSVFYQLYKTLQLLFFDLGLDEIRWEKV
jgi:hypothetical protein